MSVAAPIRRGFGELAEEVTNIVLLGVGVAVFFVVVPQIVGAGRMVRSALSG